MIGATDNEKIHLVQIVRSYIEYRWSKLPLTSYQLFEKTGVKGGLLLNIGLLLK